jgi:lysozyme
MGQTMSYQFNISDIGLRLIKAYEGYWPEARPLMTGGQVVGFGHRVESDEALSLTEDEAEEVLKGDLASIEDLINGRVHASMTQSQFDALCSFAFNA